VGTAVVVDLTTPELANRANHYDWRVDMTKSEYARFPEFRDIEVYAENDPMVEKLIKYYDTGYTGGLMEARTVDEATEYLAHQGYDHKGAIGYSDGEDIWVVFWEKR
jgi:hypothetical protein